MKDETNPCIVYYETEFNFIILLLNQVYFIKKKILGGGTNRDWLSHSKYLLNSLTPILNSSFCFMTVGDEIERQNHPDALRFLSTL